MDLLLLQLLLLLRVRTMNACKSDSGSDCVCLMRAHKVYNVLYVILNFNRMQSKELIVDVDFCFVVNPFQWNK